MFVFFGNRFRDSLRASPFNSSRSSFEGSLNACKDRQTGRQIELKEYSFLTSKSFKA